MLCVTSFSTSFLLSSLSEKEHFLHTLNLEARYIKISSNSSQWIENKCYPRMSFDLYLFMNRKFGFNNIWISFKKSHHVFRRSGRKWFNYVSKWSSDATFRCLVKSFWLRYTESWDFLKIFTEDCLLKQITQLYGRKTNSDLLRMILAAENDRASLILIVILFKSKLQRCCDLSKALPTLY